MATEVLPSAARTATVASGTLRNARARGVVLFIDVTAASATPSVVFTIQGKADADEWYDILSSAAVTGVGNTTLRVYPGLTAAANTVANDVLPPEWRVNCVHADADSITYSVTASLLN